MIPKETIAQIIDSSDIVEVIGDFVKLTKTGANYKGLSPFNTEKKPSFYVIPAKGIYKDFSSGNGGDVISFLMKHEKLSYIEAIKYLANKYKIEIKDQEPEDPEKELLRDRFFTVNLSAKEFYISQLYGPEENTLILEYIKSRFSDDEIIDWGIGIAPNKFTPLRGHLNDLGWKNEALLECNLCRKGKDSGNVYDYFRGRVMFPIENATGNICGFGGRALPWSEKDQPKYLNSSDSIVYTKSKVLYGFSRARKEIARQDMAYIVEGYSDLIAMHTAGLINTVGTCGTALTDEHITILKKHCKQINILFDGDTAGFNATLKAAELALQAGLIVLVTRIPEEEDPDSYLKALALDPVLKKEKKQPSDIIKSKQQSFILWRSSQLFENTGEDPEARFRAMKEIVRLLSLITDKSMRDMLSDELVRKYKIQRRLLKEMLDNLSEPVTVDVDDDLPAEIDAREYQRWGFYAYKNEYYFRTKDGIIKMSNFIMRPLFHIESTIDSSRLYELTNYKGHKIVVDLDMQEMTSLQAFRKHVEGRGNFVYYGMDIQFSKLKLKLYEETRSATEIKNLGWQKEGFWAWANGIILPDGSFSPIDEYGIVEFENACYYIPAFSKIYIKDKSIYEDERNFKFRSRDEITIKSWAEQFTLVYGDNGKIGIAFWIAAIFRDHLLKIFGNFPLLNLFGPKGTGKSQMAIGLSYLFGHGQKPFNLHNGTKPGLAEHLQLFINALALVDEYKNELEPDKIETLKSIYDAIGRTRMNIEKKKKETTKVNSGVILMGQHMPTADVALYSRVLFIMFHKTDFSEDEKRNYQNLKDLQADGLSHLSSQLLKHREYFTKNFYTIYDQTLKDLGEVLNAEGIESRIMLNWCSVLSAFRTIENCIKFPFTYEQLLEKSIENIRIQNAQIFSSNEVSIFWSIMETMFDENLLIEGWHFKIQYVDKIHGKTKTIDYGPGGARYILKFKFSTVISLYLQHANRMRVKPLASDTLKYYLENHEAFIIVEKECRFSLSEFSKSEGKIIEQKQITSAYCFDYDRLKINLTREAIMSKENQIPIGYKKNEDNQQSGIAASADEEELPF